MSYSTSNISARVYWHNRALIARDAFAQIATYLRQLQVLDPVFSRFYIPDATRTKYVLIAPDFSNFDQALAAALPKERGYKNPDPDDYAFSMQSMSRIGFGTMFATTPDDTQAGCWITIHCGVNGPTLPDSVDINVSSELERPEFLRALLDNTVLFWKPYYGMVIRPAMYDADKQAIGTVRVGWLTYLSNPDAAHALPPSVSWYRLADGVVIRAAEQPGQIDDPDYLRRALLVRDALAPHGFLRDPTEVATASAPPARPSLEQIMPDLFRSNS